MADDKEIKIERVSKLVRPKPSDLVTSKYAAKGYNLKVINYLEEVLARLYNDLQQYPEFQNNPELGKIVSAYRTAGRQKELWDAAKEKYKNDPEKLAELDSLVAEPGANKITPHMTGAVVDFYLGRSTDSENIGYLRKSKPFNLLSRHAYHNYKMAPYSVEPWHWECGNACKSNIENILNTEKAVANIPQQDIPSVLNNKRNPLPPEVPKEANNLPPGKQVNDDYNLSQDAISEIESSDNKKKNILKFLIGGSILLSAYLVTTHKR
jgi:hypothetical protein